MEKVTYFKHNVSPFLCISIVDLYRAHKEYFLIFFSLSFFTRYDEKVINKRPKELNRKKTQGNIELYKERWLSDKIRKSRLSSYIHIINWNETADDSKFEKRLAMIIIKYK